ncbi:hypothetical protein [Methanobacterium sp.]|uniref:hypothetical protein n=1 Tax=Methanobacterium sp. TaxID=2164 RepID=UPI0025E6C726|nr:hypothetical protein [Methanobacterium sp.]MBI5459763.1 hypothetical protein [Methanobacterium sp.]
MSDIQDLESEYEKLQLEQKIIEAKKKIADTESALNPSEMEKAKAQAEQEQAIAEAQKATLEAKLPDFNVKGPEGTITADGTVNIECHILAYQAVSEIVLYISEKIKKKHPETKAVVICDRNDLNNYFSYKIFQNQLELLKNEYEAVLSTKMKNVKSRDVRGLFATASLTGASTVLSSIVDFASLFRTDVEIKGINVEVVEDALIAELVRTLKDEITPIYPPFRTTIPYKFLTEISQLDKCRDKALKKLEDCKDNEECNKEDVYELNELNDRYKKIRSALVDIDEKTGTNRLEKLIKGEILNLELKSPGTDILYLKVVKAGGNNQTKRRFWANEIAHSGGAIIAYFLMDKDGNIKESKNLYYLSPYQRFDESHDKLNNLN